MTFVVVIVVVVQSPAVQSEARHKKQAAAEEAARRKKEADEVARKQREAEAEAVRLQQQQREAEEAARVKKEAEDRARKQKAQQKREAEKPALMLAAASNFAGLTAEEIADLVAGLGDQYVDFIESIVQMGLSGVVVAQSLNDNDLPDVLKEVGVTSKLQQRVIETKFKTFYQPLLTSTLGTVAITSTGSAPANSSSQWRMYPWCCMVVFHSLVALSYCGYSLACHCLFGRTPTFSEHSTIGEKLVIFYSFKVILLGRRNDSSCCS